jgi:hypothetical protein
MKVHTTGAAVVVATMLAGCATPYSEAPLATNFPTTKQEKVQAAAHWNAIAKDVANQISSRLTERRPIHVLQPAGKSAFERAFASQLVSSLVANDHTVMKQPTGALSVEIDTQVVGFSPNRPQYRHAGTATALMTGVWALHVGEATAGAALYATVAAADAYSWFRSEFATGETPQTEIIVTTSVSDGNQYLSRNTSVYYVADTDKALYQAGLPGNTIKVRGGE